MSVRVGTLGENLTVTPLDGVVSMTERTVCIGDVYQFGDGEEAVQLRIVQPRRPCYKINDQVSKYKVASWMSSEGITGWYFQVVKKGQMMSDTPVYLVERPHPFANLQALWQLSNQKGKVDIEVVRPWIEIDSLVDSWKDVLVKKIKKST